jgi:hypothetical protein
VNVPTNRIPVPRLVRALHWLSLAALGSTLALPGCQSASEGTPAPGQVSGQLVDVIHDRPAAGVHVRAHDMGETITDADGRFQLTLPSGTHTLYLSGEGVLSGQVERVEVRASKPLTLRAEVFPRDPSDEAINAYFERRGPRGREHPAYRSPDDPDPTVDHDHMDGDVDDHVGGAVQALVEVPAVIRVWRSSQSGALAPTLNNGWADNSCNSAVTVETLPLEEYVRGVVPHEWLSSWHDESLRAGAIAARTFAVRWALRGGRWDCADVDDGTVTQVYSSLRTDSGQRRRGGDRGVGGDARRSRDLHRVQRREQRPHGHSASATPRARGPRSSVTGAACASGARSAGPQACAPTRPATSARSAPSPRTTSGWWSTTSPTPTWRRPTPSP